jgi:transposase
MKRIIGNVHHVGMVCRKIFSRKIETRNFLHSIKYKTSEHKFVQQIHEGLKNIFFFLLHCIFFQATEKAKSFVAQLNEQMKLYPEGYDGTKMSDEQRGQYVEQKEV